MQKGGKNILIIDIGSGSVGLAIIQSGIKNTVNFATRYELEYGDKVHFGTLLEKMLLGIEHGIKQLPSKNIDAVEIFLHSPWHIIHTKKIILNDTKKFKITHKFIDEVSQKEIGIFNEQNKNNFPGYENLSLVELSIPEIKINGYTIKDPFNKKVNNCEFLLSMAFAPNDIVTDIKKICLKFLPVNGSSVQFHSATLAFTHICANLYDKNNGIMIIDVGSEITDISIVKNKTLSFGISFAEGTHDIVRKVAEVLKTTFSDALTKVHTKFSDISNKEVSLKIDQALLPVENLWQQSVSRSLAKIPKVELVPKTIILVCEDASITPWYVQSINSDTLTQYLKTDGKFQVINPNIDALKNNLNLDQGLKYIDISLGLLCISI